MFLSPNVVLSETVNSLDDLVERDGLYYKKFTDVPFSGKISGNMMMIDNLVQGSLKNGKPEGFWVIYWCCNGQIRVKSNYKNGKLHGDWISYWDNGQLKENGLYIYGKKEGLWYFFLKDGTSWGSGSGYFRDGKKLPKVIRD